MIIMSNWPVPNFGDENKRDVISEDQIATLGLGGA
jgi:hypothetical protein